MTAVPRDGQASDPQTERRAQPTGHLARKSDVHCTTLLYSLFFYSANEQRTVARYIIYFISDDRLKYELRLSLMPTVSPFMPRH